MAVFEVSDLGLSRTVPGSLCLSAFFSEGQCGGVEVALPRVRFCVGQQWQHDKEQIEGPILPKHLDLHLQWAL